MKNLILRNERGVFICQTDDEGVVLYENPIEADLDTHLLEVADEQGWQAVEGEPEDENLIYIEPVPTPVRFMGDELPENVIDLVRENGLESAFSIAKTEPSEDGGMRVFVNTSLPFGWTWNNPTEFAGEESL